ncbi:DMT family transporter [Actinospica sp.]|jgi:drug/metabolite transporter (DMT)-like permease|uniref:DMT family transporter n=1 Tax=Actinospica sp. TaxID=1872142 RepID=UPI002BA8E34F|nr:DMT family transporter [Actinospica sp.]HWG28675.1 DMT family transporter [Actinospica sp.]
MPSLLAVLASAIWGSSDFVGATLSKRRPSTAVVFLGVVLATTVLLLGIPLVHPPFGAYQWYGVAAGTGGAIALACFYKAMAAGPMSLVAPLSATSAAIPVLWSIARGGTVDLLQGFGIMVAFIGVVLASGPELREGSLVSRSTLLYTLASAIGFGLYYIFFALGSATSVYGTLLSQRIAGALILAPVALRGLNRGKSLVNGLQWSPKIATLFVFNSLGDVAANGIYGIATRHAGHNLPVVMALSGLYPVVSTVLAWALLKERLRAVQNVGIFAALVGVLLLNA